MFMRLTRCPPVLGRVLLEGRLQPQHAFLADANEATAWLIQVQNTRQHQCNQHGEDRGPRRGAAGP
jgi:hypothetical protein